MDFVLAHATDLVLILTTAVTLASLIANLTPTDADNKIVAAVGKVVNALALNFRK